MLSMATILSTSPAFAVVELIKILQYSLRNVQSTIEVVKNGIALGTSIQQTTLQGTIGAVAPNVMDFDSAISFEEFAPSLPSDLHGIVGGKSFNAIPGVRSYVDKELKSIRLGDGLTQRDVLHKINELQNQTSLDAIQKAKETLAKSNKAPDESKAQLDNVAQAKDAQVKASQETAQSIKALEKDVVYNQLSANALLTKVTEKKTALLKETQTDKVFEAVDPKAEAALEELQKKISGAVKDQEDVMRELQEKTGKDIKDLNEMINELQKKQAEKFKDPTEEIDRLSDDTKGNVADKIDGEKKDVGGRWWEMDNVVDVVENVGSRETTGDSVKGGK